ncbi:MAG: Uncharacterized protein FD135_2215 [Comamonadaceae bacterium]|nr:MAG: Uncharacterized protein FD135_2215 [Comamonadaceae bacterium]
MSSNAAVVQVRAAPFGGGEQVVAGGVVNDGLLNLAFDGQGNAHAVHRQAVDEVGGAIQRVNDPDIVRVLRPVLTARFFGPDGMAGIGSQQGFNDDLLGGLVDFGDKVIDLFLRHTDGFHIKCGAVDDGTGSAGGLHGHIDHGVQV